MNADESRLWALEAKVERLAGEAGRAALRVRAAEERQQVLWWLGNGAPPPATVSTTCCPGGIPTTLTLIDLLGNTGTMAWNGTYWICEVSMSAGGGSSGCGSVSTVFRYRLQTNCQMFIDYQKTSTGCPVANTVGTATYNGTANATAGSFSISSCSPFHLSWTTFKLQQPTPNTGWDIIDNLSTTNYSATVHA